MGLANKIIITIKPIAYGIDFDNMKWSILISAEKHLFSYTFPLTF